MASRKFKFVSPGVFLKEIDNSQLPKVPGRVGPVIIGRTRKGPSLKPYKIGSFEEFETVFGQTIPGNQAADPWRMPGGLATAYAPYAAQAYLKSQTPVTMIRLAGVLGDNASASETNAYPGWDSIKPWGLFLAPSGSITGGTNSWANAGVTASLGAIFYGTNATFCAGLTGQVVTASGGQFNRTVGTPNFTGTAFNTASFTSTGAANHSALVKSDSGKFNISLTDGTSVYKRKVSFTPGDPEYIRDVLNTNPVRTNTRISSVISGTLSDKYWLGETFEQEHRRLIAKYGANNLWAFTAPLSFGTASGSMGDFKSTLHESAPARTGWVFHQNHNDPESYNPRNLQKLFRIIAIQDGEEFGKSYMIEITNIRIPDPGSVNPYGTFSVCVKLITQSGLQTVERFDQCNLNPNSQNFIAKKIGDQFFKWDVVEKRNKVYGTNPNISQFIRVEVHPDIEETGPDNNTSVPFGFFGQIVPGIFHAPVVSGSNVMRAAGTHGNSSGIGSTRESYVELSGENWVSGNIAYPHTPLDFSAADHQYTYAEPSMVFLWPSTGSYVEYVPEREIGVSPALGATPYRKTSTFREGTLLNESYVDLNRRMPQFGNLATKQTHGVLEVDDVNCDYSYIFTLDDTVITSSTTSHIADLSSYVPTEIRYVPGSHQSGSAYTGNLTGSARALTRDVINTFRMSLHGGFEGVDVTEADPFNMNTVGSDATTANNYAYASIDRAIEIIRDPEAIEMNLAAMPGVTNENLTKKLIETCEDRADTLAIIDLPDVYIEPWQTKCTTFEERINSKNPTQVAAALTNRQINSSYGATYYPWVKVRDNTFNREVWVPPSVIALGVMAYSEERANAVWFAPAGFNRGGLNEGNAGLPVLSVTSQLLAKQRDTLYEANINPIASFITEGLVVFGQKTLQTTPSALDRINVRRLLIFIKRRVSQIASGLLFDQNVPATWNRFKSKVVPFLEGVKTELGLSDFRVILDDSTTTADLVDRNIMYAKIFLKPARAIEFIAVDFVITRTGAAFGNPE
jgi:hypothetical protein